MNKYPEIEHREHLREQEMSELDPLLTSTPNIERPQMHNVSYVALNEAQAKELEGNLMVGVTSKIISELGKQMTNMFSDFTNQHMGLLWKMNTAVTEHDKILADMDSKTSEKIKKEVSQQLENCPTKAELNMLHTESKQTRENMDTLQYNLNNMLSCNVEQILPQQEKHKVELGKLSIRTTCLETRLGDVEANIGGHVAAQFQPHVQQMEQITELDQKYEHLEGVVNDISNRLPELVKESAENQIKQEVMAQMTTHTKAVEY